MHMMSRFDQFDHQPGLREKELRRMAAEGRTGAGLVNGDESLRGKPLGCLFGALDQIGYMIDNIDILFQRPKYRAVRGTRRDQLVAETRGAAPELDEYILERLLEFLNPSADAECLSEQLPAGWEIADHNPEVVKLHT